MPLNFLQTYFSFTGHILAGEIHYKHIKDIPKSRRDVRGDEFVDLTTLAGLLRLPSCVQLPDRWKRNAVLVLDGSQTADEFSSTLVESKLLSGGDATKADKFSDTATFDGEAAVTSAAVSVLSEIDSKVSCRERFRTGDNDVGDIMRSTLGTVALMSISERNRLADFSVTDGKPRSS